MSKLWFRLSFLFHLTGCMTWDRTFGSLLFLTDWKFSQVPWKIFTFYRPDNWCTTRLFQHIFFILLYSTLITSRLKCTTQCYTVGYLQSMKPLKWACQIGKKRLRELPIIGAYGKAASIIIRRARPGGRSDLFINIQNTWYIIAVIGVKKICRVVQTGFVCV